VIAKLFPYAEHQLCLLHLERNLRRKLSGGGFKEARDLLRRVRHSRDREEGRAQFAKPCSARWWKESGRRWRRSFRPRRKPI
jgi:transposase-like protein